MRPRYVWLVLMLGAIFLLGTGVVGLGEVKKQGSSAKNPSPHPALPTVAIVAKGGHHCREIRSADRRGRASAER